MKITSRFLALILAGMLSFGPSLALAQVSVDTTTATPAPAPALPPVDTSTSNTTAPATTPVVQTAAPVVAPSDTTPPVISGVTEASLSQTDATIVWSTNELATSELRYGMTNSYGSNATLGVSTALVHTATLLGLTAGTTYYYCIDATDTSGNTSHSCDHSFSTAAATPAPTTVTTNSTSVGLDTNTPTVSAVTILPITTTTATVTWVTDEVANAEVEYGTTANYGSTSALDSNLALTHSIALSNLSPNTLYHYRVKSSDAIGNLAVTPDNTFTTDALPASGSVTVTVPEPIITTSTTAGNTNTTVSVSGVVLSSIATEAINTSSATITWHTDVPSDSQIEYGDSSLFGSVTTLNSVLTTMHSVTISNLSPNTSYIYRVKSKPLDATVATVSTNHEFSTLSQPVFTSTPANILRVQSSSITTSAATVAWTTDTQTTGQVEYGISSSYGQASATSSTLQTSHSIPLSNLVSGTTYHYRVKSLNAAGDITYSDDQTFTTATLPPVVNSLGISTPAIPVAPSTIATLGVSAHDQSSATLGFSVAAPDRDTTELYDIRYSTQPITNGNFSNATQDQVTPILYGDLQPNGTSRTYLVAGLQSNTTYYFALKSKYEDSDWSAISNIPSVTTTAQSVGQNSSISASTQSGSSATANTSSNSLSGMSSGGGGGGGYATRVESPTIIIASPNDGQIVFDWKNPNEANYVRTVVVRKEGSYPISPTDGQTIYEGRAETFSDANVTNSKTYYYSFYAYDHAKQYSLPVRVSLAPSSGNTQVKLHENPVIVQKTTADHFVNVYAIGKKDIEIEHLQELLAADGNSYPQALITGYFGTLTQAALKKFQAKHGLSQTGITDTATQKELNAASRSEVTLQVPGDLTIFTTDLKYGQSGDAVTALQEFLIKEGSYREAIVSGIFAQYTKNAVMIFQKKYSVRPISGYVGYKTRHVMQTISGL